MSAQSSRSLSSELAQRIEAFEVAFRADPSADYADFLPASDHWLFLPLLEELIRIDLERSWAGGDGKRVSDYLARHPEVSERSVLLSAIAFEEFRQRRSAGQAVVASEYSELFGIDTTDWPNLDDGSRFRAEIRSRLPEWKDAAGPVTPLPTALAVVGPPDEWRTGRVSIHPMTRPPASASPALLSNWQNAAESLPSPGTQFLGFRLVEELGRGAFGRVYLARQADLAGRPVALKVACDIADESQTLAQLQHTNIVPIYSFHRIGSYQAVCMPYFGRTTLAHVVQHISGRPVLPSSGRELRSTLNIAKDPSVPSKSASPHSGKPPSVRELPSISSPSESVREHAVDGWSHLEGLSYIEAILTLGSQLADGLGHAHRRGILHRDLKPANILLTDDGRPMLLDFNLAEDVKQGHAAERASIGGTLPYMGPEHIEAYRTGEGRLDERSDLFSLGVILFELLTGRHPFPIHKRATPESISAMVEDRRKPPPSLRLYNPAVSPAVEAVVQKCLAPDPNVRYRKADELREDIDRHLAHLPLRYAGNPSGRERIAKWIKRHPRLASSSSVAAVAALLLIAVVAGGIYARERTRGLEARGLYADHQAAFRDAQLFLDDRNHSWPRLDEGVGQLRGVLKRYGVPEDPTAGDDWLRSPSLRYLPGADRLRVKEDVGEAFYLMAQVASIQAWAATDPSKRSALGGRAGKWNELAARYGESRLPRAVREQRAAIAELRGDRDQAERLRHEAQAIPLDSARDLFLLGYQLAQQNRHREALRHLDRATRLAPESFSAWFVRGSSHRVLEQYDLALLCYTACISLQPDSAPAWMNRGLAFSGLRLHRQALEDFGTAIRLEPNLVDAFLYRAEARQAEGDLAGAEEDYTHALDSGRAPARAYFLRANTRHFRSNLEGEKVDRAAGLRVRPTDELSWIAWAENRMEKDPAAALENVEEALKLNPMSVPGLQLKAHLLSERLHRPADALAVLNRTVELHPDHVPSIAGRGVVLARAGKREAALRDAKEALRLDSRAPNLYQVACIYALTARTNPEDKREALTLLWQGLRTGFGLDIVHSDSDLDSLRQDKEFQAIVKDAETLHGPRRVPGSAQK